MTEQTSKKLFVDALNYDFVGKSWNISKMTSMVNKFVGCAKNSGWTVEVFIDAAATSAEAMKKWKTRREKEVEKSQRRVPQGHSSLLGDAFKRSGVKVHYSLDEDNDDTLMAYAYQARGAVLSQDKDMLRYHRNGRKLTCVTLYKDFRCTKDGYLNLTKRPATDVNIRTPREVTVPPPKTLDRSPGFVHVLTTNEYIRGSPSPLTRQLGNLHLVVRPLRQAVYYRMGIRGAIKEEFPVWNSDSQSVEWQEEMIFPDREHIPLLDNPEQAIKQFFPNLSDAKPHGISETLWSNHKFAMRVVVYEIVCVANPNLVLLDLMEGKKPPTIRMKKVYRRKPKEDEAKQQQGELMKCAV